MLSKIIRRGGAQLQGDHNYYGLEKYGITHKNILYNLSVGELYEIGTKKIPPCDPWTANNSISSTGALCAYSGQRTGRTPQEKRIVLDETTKDTIWWGPVNIPINPESHAFCKDMAIKYLNTRQRLYIVDGYAGWDPKYRLKVRIVCSRSYHALFMKNMLIRPTNEELMRDFKDDKNIDFHVFNAGEFKSPLPIKDVTSETTVQVNFKENQMIILGTQYAGEMKKGIFGVMHYKMPQKGVLSLHSSATEGKNGDITLFFGLSGTGKTTLSADPQRQLLGDDEHCWSDNGVFNIEGGCYAKCIGLTREKEPEIYDAIKFGAVLENINFKDSKNRIVDYDNVDITENTRACYPLEHIPNAKFPSVGGHPKNIIFLTCDAYGVLPPVSKLNSSQAMYHFISGYTAKVAGTEVGVVEPQATFSSCFGEAFLPLHPTLYADMLAQKMKQHGSNCWLVNTGWSGGKYGEGKRMSLKVTRKIIDAIHSGELDKVQYTNLPIFNLQVPTQCPGVDSSILTPKNTWSNKSAYDSELKKLGNMFQKNFKKYQDKASREVIDAGPQI
ncbi:phosphoenolpyruvate carboxykinase, putative [Ichthyophthirius multifiliis]|uniref:phosphoenolpyruvate carboxykinase (ATP) n=1 Tax=Ichthyophthirius multifiliis TaxID=5932 RepID=G0QP27_ICHMU|nr:phosphoenolpyruvate carboxykinase, putative [Ichthyophthirius multifiliis]EGR33029.1 phosphoenolpyruvate carboxykinase, putative [Ichthyophthirius multifiliis]|eukprot:XP_004037015.1 phosphoenolpyruvate carboxykinase, putative [Ichthyophthirius multifiliis]